MPLSINGTSIPSFATAFGVGQGYPDDGVYYATGDPGEFGSPPAQGRWKSDRKRINFPGVDYTAEKDFGKIGRYVYIDLVFVGDPGTVASDMSSTIEGWTGNSRFTISLPGGLSLDGCKLVNDSPPRRHPMKVKAVVTVSLTFEQLSAEN